MKIKLLHTIITTFISFLIMILVGNIYAWSVLAAELNQEHGFSATQTQVVFGVMIITFCSTMILMGRQKPVIKSGLLITLSALMIMIGYLIAACTQVSFMGYLLGYSVMGGLGVGCLYLISIQNSLGLSRNNQGLITGIVVSGFAISSSLYSYLYYLALTKGFTVSDILLSNGIGAAVVLAGISLFYGKVDVADTDATPQTPTFESTGSFKISKLFIGMLSGTFAGLLVIGNLRLIGQSFEVEPIIIITAISLFSITNCIGRILWGSISDKMGAEISIIIAMLFQACVLCALLLNRISPLIFVAFAGLLGFCFSANFVLFAKYMATMLSIKLFRKLYPLVFLGYGFGAVLGPLTYGIIVDVFGTAKPAYITAIVVSIIGFVPFMAGQRAAYVTRCK